MVTSQLVARNVFVLIDFISQLCVQKLQNNTEFLTLNIPSLGRQRCLPSWGPRRTPWFFCNFSNV